MAITQQQINQAKIVQDAAAQDLTQAVRLVAGPLTQHRKAGVRLRVDPFNSF
jgi:hypothetical protein